MGDKHRGTVSTTKSDEFIKSSVENLVPNPSESEGEPERDVPACEVFTTFSNILFDADYDFYSIDSLFDEFDEELTLLKSIPPRINETDCDLEEETHFIKRLFDSLMEEIDLSFTLDYPMMLGIEEDDYDSERDILILEEFLSNDSLSLPKNESFHLDILSSSRPPTKPPDGNLGILNVKVMGDISEQNVLMPRFMFTQPTLVPNLLPHLGHEAFQPSAECPMMIHKRNTHILDVLFFSFLPP
nr:hypothetical protein [Tanacetum cinerariifolium]